jgi:chemotaxis protein MotB
MEHSALKRRRQTIEEAGPKVPAYIVTFSDMTTLLLTFFVMLLSLADVQDPELFNKGRDAFLESLTYVGLGTLFGREERPRLGGSKTKYFIPEPDKSVDRRTIDAKTEELCRILDTLQQAATIVPSRIMSTGTSFSVTGVRFSAGQAELNESAEKFLTQFCRNLQQDPDYKPVDLYVLGLAADAENGKEQWVLSAKRAQVVANFLERTLSAASTLHRQNSLFKNPPKWTVYSWGVGAGGRWTGPHSPISDQSQILIGVFRKDG